jgi:hypothetical protein
MSKKHEATHHGVFFRTCIRCAAAAVLPWPWGKGPAKAIDTFALQRDLGKLDHKAPRCVVIEGFAM